MNESVIRSPKWLRNFVDFEVNTGDDIKGEPSKRMKKKIESERLKKEEEEKERRRKFRAEEAKAEEERKKREDKEDSDKFDELFLMVIKYIYGNYKDCKISVPNANYLTIESPDGIGVKGTDVIFKVTLNNTVGRPTFSVYIKYGKKEYSYNVSGIAAIYLEFKIFILNEVYKYYQTTGSKSSSSGSKSSSSGSGSKSSGKYDDWWNSKTPPKSEDPERENKRRRYNLLKDTRAGYKRQMDKILEWEKKNPGQKHPDNKHIVKNQLDAVQSKIDLMNSLYHFESHHYSNLLSWEMV
jgi:hypothetical protein